jgi:hydroxymethylbilane synthase
MPVLRLGTRGSLLARSQSAIVTREVARLRPEVRIETIIIKTTGDQITDRPLHEAGGKGLFVKELEQALLSNQIDFAVHSCKDLPVTMPLVDETELILAAFPPRLDPRDVLICPNAAKIAQLRKDAVVATGSLRRRCQLLAIRSDLRIEDVRGNVDTRIKKLRAGQWDAMILALAGVTRAEMFDPSIMHMLPLEQMLPAPGQGAMALQCRRNDRTAREILAALDDPPTRAAVESERAVVAALNGDCHSPIAALATMEDREFQLRAVVGHRDGNPPIIAARGSDVKTVVEKLMAQGADGILAGL